VDTYSEAWRLVCEARHLLKQYAPDWPGLEARLQDIERARKGLQEHLRAAIKSQWSLRRDWWDEDRTQ